MFFYHHHYPELLLSTLLSTLFLTQTNFSSQWVGHVWIPKEFVLLEHSHPETSAHQWCKTAARGAGGRLEVMGSRIWCIIEPHSRHIAGDQVIRCSHLLFKSLLASFPKSPYFPPLVTLILSWNDFLLLIIHKKVAPQKTPFFKPLLSWSGQYAPDTQLPLHLVLVPFIITIWFFLLLCQAQD